MTSKKEEYSKAFNELLGTDIRWERLTKPELTQLAVLFSNPEILVKRLGVKTRKRVLRDRLAKVIDELGLEGPVINLIKDLLREE